MHLDKGFHYISALFAGWIHYLLSCHVSSYLSIMQDRERDQSYCLQLDTEIAAKREPATPLPEGVRYVADTRRQSINPTQTHNTNTETTRCNVRSRGYLPIENYGMIGNMRTVALCGTDGSIDFCCYPKFDSPSIFCRLLDKNKGGHFSLRPKTHTSNKQQYLPNGNILTTRFLSDDGVAQITDYMHLPETSQRTSTKPLLPWIIRTVEVIRGTVSFDLELYPAFNYAMDKHTTEIERRGTQEEEAPRLYPEDEISYYVGAERVVFRSESLTMDFRYLAKCGDYECPMVHIRKDEDNPDLTGPGIKGEFQLQETQQVTFVLRQVPPSRPAPENETYIATKQRLALDPPLTVSLIEALFRQTANYWQKWIGGSRYRGRWREHVMRSALTLKMLTYEPVSFSLLHLLL